MMNKSLIIIPSILIFILLTSMKNQFYQHISEVNFKPEFILFFFKDNYDVLKCRYHRNANYDEAGTYIINDMNFSAAYMYNRNQLTFNEEKYTKKYFSRNEMDNAIKLFQINNAFYTYLKTQTQFSGLVTIGTFLEIPFNINKGKTLAEVDTAYNMLPFIKKQLLVYMDSLYKKNPIGKFEVYGRASQIYGDTIGGVSYNDSLALKRAKSGLNFLTKYLNGGTDSTSNSFINIKDTIIYATKKIIISGRLGFRFSAISDGIMNTGTISDQSVLIRYRDQ